MADRKCAGCGKILNRDNMIKITKQKDKVNRRHHLAAEQQKALILFILMTLIIKLKDIIL